MDETQNGPVASSAAEILREEFLGPLGIDVAGLARAMGMAEEAVSAVVDGRAPITEDVAVSLGRALGTSAEF